jgi:hypothetical protein
VVADFNQPLCFGIEKVIGRALADPDLELVSRGVRKSVTYLIEIESQGPWDRGFGQLRKQVPRVTQID